MGSVKKTYPVEALPLSILSDFGVGFEYACTQRLATYRSLPS